MRRVIFFAVWLMVTCASSFAAFNYRENIKHEYAEMLVAVNNIETPKWIVQSQNSMAESVDFTKNYLSYAKEEVVEFVSAQMAYLLDVPEHKTVPIQTRERPKGYINASYDISSPPPPLTLTEIKKRKEEEDEDKLYAHIIPAAGLGAPLWVPEQPTLDVESVLVPRQVTVISSSQDGRIASIPVNHGDRFQKGDLLIAYDCAGIYAEAEIAKIEKGFTEKRLQGSDKLFKLDIISDLDRAGAQIEDQKATIKGKLYESRLQDCDIRAEFDGRVTNRLANPGEYTRTDRVLLEVASEEPLQAEFLVPSKWLRWININAPVSLTINETEKTYTAKVTRIHGEVDPVSQSIQMIATLDPYEDALMPGMSGKATLNVNDIRDAGVPGYLEVNALPETR